MEITGVILAAGKGTRIYPFSEHHPKPILPVLNKPLMVHQIELMASIGIREIIVVIGHLGYEVVRKVGQGEEQGVKITYIEQKSTLGIAHAVGTLEKYIDRPFLLLLGDIFFATESLEMMVKTMEEEKLQSVLATKVEPDKDKIKRNFAVITNEHGLVRRVIEKPQHVSSNLKGCGIYLFDLEIFDAIRRTPRTAMRDEYEITDSIQILIDDGGKVKSLNVIEEDMNLTFPEDLLEINLAELKRQHLPCLVGRDSVIHPEAQLLDCVVGNSVRISQPVRLERCLVLDDVEVDSSVNLVNSILTPDRVINCRENNAHD